MGVESLAANALAFVLTYAIHSTLLLGLACVVVARCARKSLRLRERVWKVALFGGLVTSAVQVAADWRTPLAHWSLQGVTARDDAPAVRPNATTGSTEVAVLDRETLATIELALLRLVPTSRSRPELPVATPPDAPEADALDARDHAPVLAHTSAPSFAESDAAALSSAARFDWRAWITGGLLAWGAFAAFVVALFAWMCLRLARRLRGRRELRAGELRLMLDRLTFRAFRGGRVRLFVAPELAAPLSFGWVRPAICVPARALTELSHEEQETMLAHELAHLVRRDPLWLSLAWLVERVFFFQPLNRVARADLHDVAELLSDEWAATRTGNRVALASCLARIASWIVGHQRALPATSMADGHGRSRLGQRIERLLDDSVRPHEGERRRVFVPLAAGLLATAVLLAPGVSAAKLDLDADVPRSNGGWPTPSDEELACESADVFEPSEASIAAQDAPAPLAADIAALDAAVEALAGEIEQLRAELALLELDEPLAQMLADLESRAERLARRRVRLHRILDQASSAPNAMLFGLAGDAVPVNPVR